MGHIFLSAGHFLGVPGASAFGTTETKEVIKVRDAIEKIFDAKNIEYSSVPDNLTLKQTISWINARSNSGDVAVEIHLNASKYHNARGTEAFYIAGNSQRKAQTELLLKELLNKVPELKNRGAKPDTQSQHGSLGFCRQVDIPSILVELCFIDNKEDFNLLQNHRDRFAKGLANGLITWSKQKPDDDHDDPIFPTIKIRLNGENLQQSGIIKNNNSYIPVDLVELLGVDLNQLSDALKVTYGNIVYVKAVELNQFDIAIGWESSTRTVILDSKEALEEKIMAVGQTTQAQLEAYLNKVNSEALQKFPDIAKLYIEEAKKEGVNHDIAFAQMCLETGNLEFGNQVTQKQNNFCGLGAVDGGGQGASFKDTGEGAKACVQHLKAYGSDKPISHPPIVDPRFDLVKRGVASTVYDLAGRWASDSQYGKKIMAILRRINNVV